MRQLFEIFKAKENEIDRPRFLIVSCQMKYFYTLGVTLKKHLQPKCTFTSILAQCIITHHV